MQWLQKEIRLEPRPRGFHLVTGDVMRQLPEIAQFTVQGIYLCEHRNRGGARRLVVTLHGEG